MSGPAISRPAGWSQALGEAGPEGVALRHALFWMMAANGIGLGLACLLLFPPLNQLASPWTYGRWMPAHMNLHLYGWTSLPLVAWLFRAYRVGQTPAGACARSAVWVWSMALAAGVGSWLAGGSSGKLFLDWRGYPRFLFTAAMVMLWGVLFWAWVAGRAAGGARGPRLGRVRAGRAAVLAQGLGLLALLAVPPVWFWAAGPSVYPAVNPDSGGPTGASLLGSTLIVVLLVLLFPTTVGKAAVQGRWRLGLAWGYFLFEMALYGLLNRSHASHHEAAQIFGLGSLVPWLVVLPVYYRSFEWPKAARRWEAGFLAWMGLLLLTGWVSFLPGVLERLKFTDGLVAHSHLAMAGFVTSFNAFILTVLLEGRPAGSVFAHRPAFWMWQVATLGFVLVMWISGWIEGGNPSFTMVPSAAKNVLYGIRAGCGVVLMATSALWWLAAVRAGDTAWRERPAAGRNSLVEAWAAARPPELGGRVLAASSAGAKPVHTQEATP